MGVNNDPSRTGAPTSRLDNLGESGLGPSVVSWSVLYSGIVRTTLLDPNVISWPFDLEVSMASLSEISQRAGVSVATASRVLNGSSHAVAASTRDRVLAAAEDLGYSPSALARALASRKSRIIGVIVGDITDPYYAEIARGVEEVAGAHGYLTMVCSADRNAAAEIEHVYALRDYHAAGVIFASSGYVDDEGDGTACLAAAVAEVKQQGSTVVSVAPRDFECISATVDNQAAAYDITRYLISLGHRRIAFVEGPAGVLTSNQRSEGFAAAMAGAGLAVDLRYDGGATYESGTKAALELLGMATLPDAIVAARDEVAIGLLMTLRQAGVDVPESISIVGIDDTRPAYFVDLTTVKLPLYDLGALAARSVLAEHGDAARPESLVLPHELVPRGTTARRHQS
jgi:LacI family transcriptional regulator